MVFTTNCKGEGVSLEAKDDEVKFKNWDTERLIFCVFFYAKKTSMFSKNIQIV